MLYLNIILEDELGKHTQKVIKVNLFISVF